MKLCFAKHICVGIRLFSKIPEVMKVLNVAEKNDAAKNIVRQLVGQFVPARNGLSTYNKNYDFQLDLFGRKCSMVMTSVSGHLLGLDFGGSYKRWEGCDPLLLFRAPVGKYCSDDYLPIKRNLQKEVRGCQALIIWTDCDREGENIGFEVAQVCREAVPTIDIYRAKFSEITQPSVWRAVRNLERPDEKLSQAVDVRMELDLRIGAAFTRFLTLRYQKLFPGTLTNSLVSYGSCQFPTLGFVVERYKAHEDFQAEPFWKLRLFDEKDGNRTEFHWKRGKVFSFRAADIFYNICVESNRAKVTAVTQKPTSKWRPVALDTIQMEKLGSWKLKINAKEMMKIAEKLYTGGFISYPRTETNIFPKEINLNNLIESIAGDERWQDFARNILNSGGAHPRNGKKSDNAHPPIHPLKIGTGLSGQEARVYEFIARHFLACCSRDARGMETVVDVELGEELFSANGLIITDRGYLEVYPYDRWSDKELRAYERGEEFVPSSLDIHEGSTTAPPLLSEADLIALMEAHGIGTDATHADHIETIKARNYVKLTSGDSRFLPGDLGLGLVEGYDAMGFHLSKPHLRSGLESDLTAICDGRKNPDEVLSDQIGKYEEVFRLGMADVAKLDEALERRLRERQARGNGGASVDGSGWGGGGGGGGGGGPRPDDDRPSFSRPTNSIFGKCPKCDSHMMLKAKKQGGWMAACMGFPDCKVVSWFPSEITDVSVSSKCRQCDLNQATFRVPRGVFAAASEESVTFCLRCGGSELERFQLRPLPKKEASSGSIASVFQSRTTSSAVPDSRSVGVLNSGVDRLRHYMPTVSFMSGISSATFPIPRGNNQSNMSRIPNTYSHHRDVTQGNNRSDVGDEVKCKCGNPANLLTVKKEGPNTGRKFYACAKSNGTDCNFFSWEDAVSAPRDRPTGSTISFPAPQLNGSNSSFGVNSGGSFSNPGSWDGPSNDVQEYMCDCNVVARKFTVNKEGPNKGREFYVCSKNQGDAGRCSFFLWADSNPSSVAPTIPRNTGSFERPIRSRGTSRGRARGRGTGAGRGAPGGRKCGICGNTGHNRKNCPNRFDGTGNEDW
ncbi:unnamed protein product [Notodromas monacha]|uniref:DNA topoisomerase n=1 Tax=Notodromas monacha TaxID=399045 RepID=A0A7R9GAY3_9CRUS|nr:unnamed protein product [Notodromas monacha]CAG0915750.1 unnamed protein product [Notodromas monacha]